MTTHVDAGPDRELLISAATAVITSQIASTTHIQRRIRVGFAKAGRLIGLLEDAGVVGPLNGTGLGRNVLVTPDQLDDVLAALRGDHL